MKARAWLLRIGIVVVAASALFLDAGCKPSPKPITESQRKEADLLASEASFAITLRDWTRAEGLLAKATQLAPDTGVYWISLGSMRMRLGNKAGAKAAYEGALQAYQAAALKEEGKADAELWLKQMQALALLGRTDDARAMLEKTARRFPEDRNVRAFVDSKAFDRMIADPAFKQGSL